MWVLPRRGAVVTCHECGFCPGEGQWSWVCNRVPPRTGGGGRVPPATGVKQSFVQDGDSGSPATFVGPGYFQDWDGLWLACHGCRTGFASIEALCAVFTTSFQSRPLRGWCGLGSGRMRLPDSVRCSSDAIKALAGE